jgi:predicted phosphodiesterase
MNTSGLPSRRDFLRSAGGLTFLALTSIGRGQFAAISPLKPLALPLFLAVPYIQPGPESRLVEGAEAVRLAWQTVQQAADFKVEFGRDENYGKFAEIKRNSRTYLHTELDSVYNYVCTFSGLRLGTEYKYRVRCNDQTVAEGYFTTRQPRGRKIRFVAFGDNSHGAMSDHAVAYQAYRANPDFIMNTGDNVYEGGLDNEYSRYFFPVYNADVAGPRLGAPLMRSVPFYSVLGNHDADYKDAQKRVAADFARDADAGGFYTNFHFPLNGPVPEYPTPVRGPAARLDDFKACAGERYPRMANYSYDCGDAHFICLDSHIYNDPTSASLQRWVEDDLSKTDARWRFAVYHHPAFNVGMNHAHEQQMRVLSPIFEKYGVDLALSGHEHNYQRTKPLRFVPGDVAQAHTLHSKMRLVPGEITVDQNFDGEQKTKATGIIHIVTGAGGKYLYDGDYNNSPEKWVLPEDKNVPYVVKLISDRHSISVIDIDGNDLWLKQIDERGNEIDSLHITKT